MDLIELKILEDSIGGKVSEMDTRFQKQYPLSKCNAQYLLNPEIPIYDEKLAEENIEYVLSLIESYLSREKQKR